MYNSCNISLQCQVTHHFVTLYRKHKREKKQQTKGSGLFKYLICSFFASTILSLNMETMFALSFDYEKILFISIQETTSYLFLISYLINKFEGLNLKSVTENRNLQKNLESVSERLITLQLTACI